MAAQPQCAGGLLEEVTMNVNWSEELRALDRVGPSRDLWADALARVEAHHPRHRTGGSALASMRSWRRRTAVAASAAVLVALGAGSALAYHYLGPSPGFTAGLTGLESLPTAPWPSTIPTDGLPQMAEATGLTAREAEQRMRLVQSGLSRGDQTGLDLYAFPGNAGSGCIFLTPSGGICLPTDATNDPALDGVAWAAWGSDGPRTPSGPLAAFGLVADNVRQVEVDISGITRSIPIIDNSFYDDIDSITSTDTIKLIVHFDDGTSRTFSAPNPYGDNGPIQILPYTPTRIPNPPTRLSPNSGGHS
jgi:hypothetical protein